MSAQSADLHLAGAARTSVGASSGLLPLAHSLEPLIRRCEEEIEASRRLPDELVDALYDAGVFSAFRPREVGGLEVDLLEWLDLIEELSRIDGSVGWNAFINAGTTLIGPEPMRRIVAKERWITAGNIGRAAGKAYRVDGGYRITGRWPFASGAPFATYLFGRTLVYDEQDEPVLDPATGMQASVMALWPASEATLHDTWDGLGLRGTSSVDIEVTDLFVPDEFVQASFLARPYPGPLYRTFFQLQGHCAHALGIARCAIDAFVAVVQEAQARPPHGSTRQPRLGLQQRHQIAVAEAETLVQATRMYVWDVAERAWENAQHNEVVDYELRVQLAQAMIFSVRSAKQAVSLVFEQAGTSSVFRGSPIERCYRDVATAAQHTLVVETSYDTIGQYYLTRGLPGGPRIDVRHSLILPPHPQAAAREEGSE